jgi:hypothetical protein
MRLESLRYQPPPSQTEHDVASAAIDWLKSSLEPRLPPGCGTWEGKYFLTITRMHAIATLEVVRYGNGLAITFRLTRYADGPGHAEKYDRIFAMNDANCLDGAAAYAVRQVDAHIGARP